MKRSAFTKKSWIRGSILFSVLIFIYLCLHRCSLEPGFTLLDNNPTQGLSKPRSPDSSQSIVLPSSPPLNVVPSDPQPIIPSGQKSPNSPSKNSFEIISAEVIAKPWGGLHYDSVDVSLLCRQSPDDTSQTCVALWSTDDTTSLMSYNDHEIRIRRSTRLWVAALDSLGRRSELVSIYYDIKPNLGLCPASTFPITVTAETNSPSTYQVCMDEFEWPNRDNALPQSQVTWEEAKETCASVQKRLCSIEEWRSACQGPEAFAYPYGTRYQENRCPAKESELQHSGRFPACRSYNGTMDLTGNLWEWTSTQKHEGYYLAAGGSWESGNQASCLEAKYSFFPQNRYVFMGFRCCQAVLKK